MVGMELIEAGKQSGDSPYSTTEKAPSVNWDSPLWKGKEGIPPEIDAFLRLLAEWMIEDRLEEREETDV